MRYIKSCGFVAYKKVGDEVYYLIIKGINRDIGFPKGHMEAGETEEQTALRELMEETGLTATLDTDRFASIEYPISGGARKQVIFYLGEISGCVEVGSGEIEAYKWVSAEELKDHLLPDTVRACKALLE